MKKLSIQERRLVRCVNARLRKEDPRRSVNAVQCASKVLGSWVEATKFVQRHASRLVIDVPRYSPRREAIVRREMVICATDGLSTNLDEAVSSDYQLSAMVRALLAKTSFASSVVLRDEPHAPPLIVTQVWVCGERMGLESSRVKIRIHTGRAQPGREMVVHGRHVLDGWMTVMRNVDIMAPPELPPKGAAAVIELLRRFAVCVDALERPDHEGARIMQSCGWPVKWRSGKVMKPGDPLQPTTWVESLRRRALAAHAAYAKDHR